MAHLLMPVLNDTQCESRLGQRHRINMGGPRGSIPSKAVAMS